MSGFFNSLSSKIKTFILFVSKTLSKCCDSTVVHNDYSRKSMFFLPSAEVLVLEGFFHAMLNAKEEIFLT